ncbi:MAG: FkbM family methyltransferase [Flavobacteriales bacterium]|nr:FkbM family methyltransferase [Flavobacteriales bacterium]MCB9167324.1 FkbM family methyltransferase [Flavobacteriales bacterium]
MRDYAYYGDLTLRQRILNIVRGVFRIGPLERWLRERTEGSPVTSHWCRLMPPEYAYPKGSHRTIVRDGLTYELDLSNATDHGVYFGYADPGDANLMGAIGPDHVVVDIGGNIGVRAMAFARRVPRGRVITLEPDPENFAKAVRHFSLNGLENITALRVGVGPEEATHRLYRVVSSNSGMNRIITQGPGSELERFPFREVRVRRLDEILQEAGIGHVDVIKIDVEGFEMEVLKGCMDVLERDHPLLFVEVDDENLRDNGSSAGELLAWLRGSGYATHDAERDVPLEEGLEFAHCHFDVLCRPVSQRS